MKASSRLHHLLFSTVMRASVSFFDLTPRGRIVNRFSRDMDESKNNVDFLQQRLITAGQHRLLCIAKSYWFKRCLSHRLTPYSELVHSDQGCRPLTGSVSIREIAELRLGPYWKLWMRVCELQLSGVLSSRSRSRREDSEFIT